MSKKRENEENKENLRKINTSKDSSVHNKIQDTNDFIMVDDNIPYVNFNQESRNKFNMKFEKNLNLFKVKKLNYKSIWSNEEDRLLLFLVNNHGNKKWKLISKFFKDKNPIQCSARYRRIKPGNLKGKWTKEEDGLLVKLNKIYKNNWSAISKIINTRTAKQVRDRYVNCLDPRLKKGNFSKEEDEKIIYYYNIYGPNWLKISQLVKFRTADTIKNRYYLYLKKKNIVKFDNQNSNDKIKDELFKENNIFVDFKNKNCFQINSEKNNNVHIVFIKKRNNLEFCQSNLKIKRKRLCLTKKFNSKLTTDSVLKNNNYSKKYMHFTLKCDDDQNMNFKNLFLKYYQSQKNKNIRNDNKIKIFHNDYEKNNNVNYMDYQIFNNKHSKKDINYINIVKYFPFLNSQEYIGIKETKNCRNFPSKNQSKFEIGKLMYFNNLSINKFYCIYINKLNHADEIFKVSSILLRNFNFSEKKKKNLDRYRNSLIRNKSLSSAETLSMLYLNNLIEITNRDLFQSILSLQANLLFTKVFNNDCNMFWLENLYSLLEMEFLIN